MVNVAIIDNGLKEDIIKSSNILLRKIWCKKTKKQFAQEYHATICAKIIQEFSDNVRFYDLVVMQENGNIIDVIKALEWCLIVAQLLRHKFNLFIMN